ncbi:toprim domain-containing protein, partial [Pandoraea communis]|uniref:toprim domain-containing protein n=1 Tax=Pandoraea communis TaxID=2508297 RepID=UPI0025A54B0E
MRDLVIVEATGKVRRMEALLRQVGIRADVIATAGHIADNPAKLSPIALTPELRETDYRFRTDRRELLDKIRSSAAHADRIFVATDDDQEGDVIAHDVARLLESRNDRLQRVRLRAITPQEIKQSFLDATRDGFAANACAGECRRIVDRAIGATFASVGTDHVLPVGRVQSSALISIAEAPPVVGSFGLELEGSDGGIYRCSLPVRSGEDLSFAESLVDALGKGAMELKEVQEVLVPVAQRWNYEDVVSELALRMRLDVRQAADAFQTAYEEGYVSYPRVRS